MHVIPVWLHLPDTTSPQVSNERTDLKLESDGVDGLRKHMSLKLALIPGVNSQRIQSVMGGHEVVVASAGIT